MSDYIKRDDAIVQLSIDFSNLELPKIKESLDKIPSADVIEVVHCKDCRFYRQGTMNFHGRCNWHGGLDPDEDWFCADGERSDEVNDGRT